nr:MAG TPA: hypothetical protein [Caudoviricetes sp.]
MSRVGSSPVTCGFHRDCSMFLRSIICIVGIVAFQLA